MTLWDEIIAEAQRAQSRHGNYTSSHEALGVLIEEVDEHRAAIHTNQIRAIRGEAIQIAAVTLRLALACDDAEFRERSQK